MDDIVKQGMAKWPNGPRFSAADSLAAGPLAGSGADRRLSMVTTAHG